MPIGICTYKFSGPVLFFHCDLLVFLFGPAMRFQPKRKETSRKKIRILFSLHPCVPLKAFGYFVVFNQCFFSDG